jgi:hypothetical protein
MPDREILGADSAISTAELLNNLALSLNRIRSYYA